MSILTWMEEQREKAIERERYRRDGPLPTTPENSLFARKQLWVRCELCGVILYISHLPEYHHTCKECGENIPMTPEERVASLIDPNTWRPTDELFSAGDPLVFNDKKSYVERLAESQERTGAQDAVITGTGRIDNIPIALGVMNFEFMGGSMGSVVGEKVTRLIEYATRHGVMLIMVCASGGARMQEGVLSLMQMAKISAALYSHQCTARLNYISVLTSPTTGGVTASFAMLGDVIIAEPKAVIGFAGRRVIEQTLGETLPDDFQTAEYLMDHGLVDLIIHRKYLKLVLVYLLNFNVSGHYRQPGYTYAEADFGENYGNPVLTDAAIESRKQALAEAEAKALAEAEAKVLAEAEAKVLAEAKALEESIKTPVSEPAPEAGGITTSEPRGNAEDDPLTQDAAIPDPFAEHDPDAVTSESVASGHSDAAVPEFLPQGDAHVDAEAVTTENDRDDAASGPRVPNAEEDRGDGASETTTQDDRVDGASTPASGNGDDDAAPKPPKRRRGGFVTAVSPFATVVRTTNEAPSED